MEPDPTPTPPRRAGRSWRAVLAVAATGPRGAGRRCPGRTRRLERPPAAETGAAARDKRDCPEHERGGAGREDNSAGSFDESREL